jgi:hypothetical protein
LTSNFYYSSSIARWIKTVLASAGVDTEQFKAHSTRAAAASAAKSAGVSLKDIMTMADWSRESTFTRFYHKPVVQTEFDQVVLSTHIIVRTLFVAFKDTLSCMQAYHDMELKVLQGSL